MKSKIVAGVVGGDMHPSAQSEHEYPRDSEVNLRDMWEDDPVPPAPVKRPAKKDDTYGRAKGNTWGYQTSGRPTRKRCDKFLYTGPLETIPIDDIQDGIGRLRRFGIGLTTEVDAWERETAKSPYWEWERGPGGSLKMPEKQYYSQRQVARFRQWRSPGAMEGLIPTKVNDWVSDHFGIAIGIKILGHESSTT